MNELLIVKIGTSSVVDEAGQLNSTAIKNIAEAVTYEKSVGKDVMLVLSGAISAGAAELGVNRSDYEGRFDELSALAAVGQIPLMHLWSEALAPYHLAQNLVTPLELASSEEGPAYIRKAVATLGMGAIVGVNENDAVADDEIKYGDNDSLMANIAVCMHRLGHWTVKPIILTDVDGLYDRDPRDSAARQIKVVRNIDSVREYAVDGNSEHGTGFMDTKLDAAKILGAAGLSMHLGLGSAEQPIRRLTHRNEGTLFAAAA